MIILCVLRLATLTWKLYVRMVAFCYLYDANIALSQALQSRHVQPRPTPTFAGTENVWSAISINYRHPKSSDRKLQVGYCNPPYDSWLLLQGRHISHHWADRLSRIRWRSTGIVSNRKMKVSFGPIFHFFDDHLKSSYAYCFPMEILAHTWLLTMATMRTMDL